MWKKMPGRKICSPGLVGMILGALVGLFPGPAQSASWQMNLWVKAGSGENRLVIGQEGTATGGYDSQWEVEAFLSRDAQGAQTGDIEAYFSHPEWGLVHVNYWQDIRDSSGGKKSWDLTVSSRLPDALVEIRWDPSQLIDKVALNLIDEKTGAIIDMRSIDHYSFSGDASRGLRIETPSSSDDPPPPVPLPPPPVLKGSRRGKTGVTLQWNGAQGGVIGYNVYRSTTPGGGYDKINPNLILARKPNGKQIAKVVYIDKGLIKGNKYYYVVTSVNSLEAESLYSNEVMVNIK